jgi:hypothetical protein
MISAYAALYRAGFPSSVAFWGQATIAGLALLGVVLGAARGMSTQFALGITAMVSVMISPYAYDYDLPMLGIGLALMLPELPRMAGSFERSIMYGLILLAGGYGLLQSARIAAQFGQKVDLDQHFAPAIAGLAMMALLALLLRMLWRAAQPAPAPQQAAE